MTTEYARRLDRLRAGIRKKRLDAMIVLDRVNTRYLTGFTGSLSYLIVTKDEAILFVDGRYIESAKTSVPDCEVRLFKTISETMEKWAKAFAPRRLGLEACVPHADWLSFDRMIPGREWEDAGGIIHDMRLVKSASEIQSLAASAASNDEIYEAAIAALRPGMTELDVRNFIRAEADRRGLAGLSFDCIVAAGANGSMPHYRPGPSPLKAGELLLIDMGVIVEGYCSDMTRVVALGREPKAKARLAFDAVLEAEQAAIKAAGPGVRCADLHKIAVETLKKHKLDRRFTHGLGHGVGLEIHEDPRLNAKSEATLKPGMVITFEPGVYLPGLCGVRIEDLAVVTAKGVRLLSGAKKDFRVVPFG